MNLQEYFQDKRKLMVVLDKDHPDGVVHVTSVFHRERNSTPGATASATVSNAARVITDGTHREATPAEVREFLAHQERQRVMVARSEQLKKKQYIVVVDNEPGVDIPDVVGSENVVDRRKNALSQSAPSAGKFSDSPSSAK